MYQLTADPNKVLVLENHPELPTGTIIHNESRFWADYEAFIAAGGEAIPVNPFGDCGIWDGTKWVEDTAEKERREALAYLRETDHKQARAVDDIIDHIINAAQIPQVVIDRFNERKLQRGKVKK